MNRRSNRSRSVSPASSIERKSSIKKKNVKTVKSKEDVQVFTSLPPKVEGDIKCYLKLQITKLNLFSEPTKNENIQATKLPNRNSKPIDKNSQNKVKFDNIIARCVWWGEENATGALFRPRILGSATQDPKKLQTTAKYMVRSGPKQFAAYLNDMKTLDIELIDGNNMEVIGKIQMFEIAQLSTSNPIKGFFPAYDSAQVKIAEVYVSVQFESLLQDSIDNKKASDQSDVSRPTTPTSMANINEFYTKYQKFEKKQLELNNVNNQIDLFGNNNLKNPNMFNSNSYINILDEEMNFHNGNNSNNMNLKNPIISNLIERGLKLRQEMTDSSSSNLPYNNLNEITSLSDYKSYESLVSANKQPIYSSTHKNIDFQFPTKKHNNPSMISFITSRNHPNNLPDFIDETDPCYNDNLNDVSRLSDPLHDPNILSALIYDHANDSILKNFGNNQFIDSNLDEDQELKNLLEPTDLFSRLVNKDIAKTNNFIIENQIHKPIRSKDDPSPMKNFKEKLKKQSLNNIRHRSVSRSSMSSNCSSNYSDDDSEIYKDNSKHIGRVSFELQSSDGEGSVCNERCIDVLSDQRISLLNLIQIARLKIDKLSFFTSMPLSKLMDRINKIEQTAQQHQALQNYQQTTKSINSKSKPPIAIKRVDFGQLFFIEYQFPVIANSRDSYTDQSDSNFNLMATQVMRVISKRMKKQEEMNSNVDPEDIVIFDHNADYSVLFNSHSLESWWKSYILFKIYLRPPILNNSNKNSSSNMFLNPYLIGSSRLSLRNVLKSRNFKLYKKLAINDQLSDSTENKRIGTLNVSLELSSDLNEFKINLAKLKNSEERFKHLPKEPQKQSTNVLSGLDQINNFGLVGKKLEINKIQRNILNNNSNFIQPVKINSIEEFSIPIQMFLSINEGKGFNSNINDISSIYLICRLFWNKEKVKFETTKTTNDISFCWTINLSFMIKPSIIENMRNNYMIIEAWKKSTNSENDSFVGTIKLPLHEFYLKTNDLANLKEHLKDTNRNPLIGVDGWISAFDPFTGQKAGEINVLLALGSNEQILGLQKILFDKVRIKNENKKSPIKENAKLIAHVFTFKIDNIKVHPVRTSSNHNEMILDEANFYIKYWFPSTPTDTKDPLTSAPKFNSHLISTRLNSNFSCKLEHIIIANENQIQNEIFNLFKNQENLIRFELWSRSHYPNLRERLIGKGELSIEKLISIINNKESNLDINNRSFVVPLAVAQEESNTTNYNSDKFIGQLFITIEYKNDQINRYNFDYDKSICLMPKTQKLESNFICMNVGILRANGLKSAITNIISKNCSSLLNIENSNIYVKFSLSFLNRPHDFKQTRLISSSLSGYTPEFFDYFDLECPLISKYSTNTKRTISLAEQLELGQINFEVWTKFIDVYNKNSSDVLLGTCAVPLETLLENRIGIRGWIPIRSVVNSSVLSTIIDEQNIGSLEVAIRFTKNDDYLKIIQTAKEIGWVRSSDLELKNQISNFKITDFNHQNVPSVPKLNLDQYNEPIDNIKSDFGDISKLKVKCLLEIERAIHLPKVYDEKTNRHVEPNAFVSFSTNLNNPSETVQTKICERKSSPVWNYQLLFQVDSEYFLEESKYLILKVWHRYSLSDDISDSRSSNKILGYVSIDLQPLICGLSHLNGWYNIQDSVCNCQGQLKINFLPQENLFPIKELYLKRKKLKESNSNEKNLSIYNSRMNCPSQNSLYSYSNHSTTYSSLNSPAPSVISSQKSSNIENSLKEVKDKNELKNGLLEKLSELDQLNKLLRERLEKKSVNTVKKIEEENEKIENINIYKINKNVEPKIDFKEVKKIEKLDEQNIDFVKKIETKNSDEIDKKLETEIEIEINEPKNFYEKNDLEKTNSEKMNSQNKEEVKSNESKSKENNKKNISVIHDSFWASSIASDSKSEKSFNGVNLETVESIESDIVEHLPPVFPHNDNNKSTSEEENVKKCQSENLNDTELDQTFNLNASYEIVPNRNSQNSSPAIDTYDFIEKIDCNKLDKEDELNIDEFAKYKNDESLFISNHKETRHFKDDESDVNEENEENLTVIVPEVLNKIEDEDEKNEEIKVNVQIQDEDIIDTDKLIKIDNDSNEKNKNLNSKIPNYFLPQEDLEKTMKRLHYNYANITSNDNQETESEADENLENNLKIKVKSTTLLIQNQKVLKQDLNRINKIFHTKFN